MNYSADDFIIAMRRGEKINAIKMLRAITDGGLKECKDVVEALMPFVPFVPEQAPYVPNGFILVSRSNGAWEYTVSKYDTAEAAVDVANELLGQHDDTELFVAKVTHKTGRTVVKV